VLRYHGGKWRLAPWIIAHLPPHRVYVEPFGGAASVLLQKPRSYAEVYNDLDGDMVNVFRVLRDPQTAAALKRALSLTPFARAEFEVAYTSESDDPVERARCTMVRAQMGYGSAAFNSAHATGFRTYTGGNRGRLPAKDWGTFPDQIEAFVERLRGVVIEQRDACEIMSTHDARSTLHYLDPPYVLSTRGSAAGVRQKYRHEMDDAEHEELAEFVAGLQGMVVMSGYQCSLYDGLYGGWRRVETETLADGAEKRTECLWLNAACVTALGHGPLFNERTAEVVTP
jgi:DNA adenine methylase